MSLITGTAIASEQSITEYNNEAGLPKWKELYKIAGIATIVMLILIPIQIAVFTIWPAPTSINEWFQLFQKSWLLGLLHLDFLYIINNIIVAIMYLAFYFSLRKKSQAKLLIALVIGLLGIAAYFSSNSAFEMLSLSQQFALSASETERVMFLSSGQSMLAQWRGTAFDIYYILNGITLLIIAGVMFKSSIYSRFTAVIGLIAGILMVIPSTAGSIGLIFSLASLVPWVIFATLVAIKFLKLGRTQ